jgi:iterative type I PKS product template protein
VTGMVRATLGQQINAFPTLQRGREPWPLITAALTTLYAGSLDICWAEYHREFKASHRVLELPAYSWDLKEYWIQYEHDWVLDKVGLSSKGEATKPVAPKPVAPKPEPKAVIKPAPKLESTTVHKTVSETIEGPNATIVVESDISRPDLFPIAQGHKVGNIPLCTPSVYADIALSLGTYLLDRFQPEMKERLVDVSGLTVESALIPHGKGPQLLHTSAKVDWATKSAECMFYSVDDKRQKTTEHGWCTLQFKDRSRFDELQKKAPEILARMNRLREGIASGRSLRMNSAQGYKFISPLAQFAPDYRAVDEVILDSETLESTMALSFANVKKGGSFKTHPAYIDCLTQTGGFVMNCKDSTDLSMEVYVNHGWESFQIYEEISPDKTY